MRTFEYLWLAAFLITAGALQAQTEKRQSNVPPGPPPAFEVRQALDASAQVLLNVIRPGYNPIPLAVLNKARCALFINSKGAQDAWGIASCRIDPNRWTAPAFVSFHGSDRAEASRQRELLVLLMNPRATHSLLQGRLTLGSRGSQPGLLVSSKGNIRGNQQITATTFTYNRVGESTLQPTAVHATLVADEAMTHALYAGKANVARVLRGHAVAPGIAASYVTALASFFNTITPEGIIIHHSATLPTSNRVPTTEREVDLFHRSRGFAVACFGTVYHVAYHYFILPNGTVKAGRPENCQGAHAHGYNAYLGISVAGDFSSADNPNGAKGLMRPTPAQMKSLRDVTERLMRKYKISPTHVVRHSDVAKTACPGDRFPFKAFVQKLRVGSSTAAQ